MEREKFIRCYCLGEGVLISEDLEENEIYLSIYELGMYRNSTTSLWKRLKYAWCHIRTGKIYKDCIILSHEKANEMADFIKDLTKQ